MRDGVVVLDRTGSVVDLNPATEGPAGGARFDVTGIDVRRDRPVAADADSDG